MPYARERAPIYAPVLDSAMLEFRIDSLQQQACFLANVAHESGSLRYTLELADGEAYDTGALAKRLGNTPEDDDDGRKYKGHGLMQVTGKANIERCLAALGRPLDDLAYLLTPIGAARSAAWFWSDKGLNEPAARGLFGTIRKIINGGYNGLDECIIHYVRIRKVFNI